METVQFDLKRAGRKNKIRSLSLGFKGVAVTV